MKAILIKAGSLPTRIRTVVILLAVMLAVITLSVAMSRRQVRQNEKDGQAVSGSSENRADAPENQSKQGREQRR